MTQSNHSANKQIAKETNSGKLIKLPTDDN